MQVAKALPGELPDGARWLSRLEKQIIAALAGGGWLSSDRLAQAIKYDGDLDRLKAILTNLADTDIVESATGKGYRIKT